MGWDVVVYGTPYEVWRVPGYVHTIGGRWGNNEYWMCPRNETPTYSNLIMFDMDHPVRYGVNIQDKASLRNHCGERYSECRYTITITRNDDEFYSFITNSMSYGMAKAYMLITELQEGPINWNSYKYRQEIEYRVLSYKGKIYTTYSYLQGQAEVLLRPGRYTPEEMKDWINRGDHVMREDILIDLLMDRNYDWYPDSKDEEF